MVKRYRIIVAQHRSDQSKHEIFDFNFHDARNLESQEAPSPPECRPILDKSLIPLNRVNPRMRTICI